MTVTLPSTPPKGTAGGDIGPLEWSRKFAGGIRADIKRRQKFYGSDWVDAFRSGNTMTTVASILFLFFACISPAIAFGLLFQDGCGQHFGVVEMILSSAIAGIFWALFSGQPLCILGATGPVLAYTVVIYSLYNSMVGPQYFLPMYFWTGVWFSGFTILLACSDMCCVVKHVTKFTEEIFSGLISCIFIVEAIKPTIKNFHSTTDSGSRYYLDDSALLQAFLTFGTYMLATKLASLKTTNLLNPIMRKILSSFGVTISILVFTGLAAIWASPKTKLEDGSYSYGSIKIPFLSVPTTIQPTFEVSPGVPRAWIVSPMGADGGLPIWAIFFAILPAAGFAVLGFLDQNLTTLLVNRKANRLQKPPAYHLDMLVCGFFIYPICTILCLPFPVAATVRSLTHLISLTKYEQVEIEGGGVRKVPVDVVEQRVTNLGIHILIGLSLVLASILKFVPKPVLLGVFLFMGVSSLNGNELFERLHLWAIFDSSKFPKYPYVGKVSTFRLHLFTFLQLLMLGVLYALKSIKQVAVVFPFFIASLVFIRWGFSCMFTAEELDALDGHDADEEVHNDDPDSPLKRVNDPEVQVTKFATEGQIEKQGLSPNKQTPTKADDVGV